MKGKAGASPWTFLLAIVAIAIVTAIWLHSNQVAATERRSESRAKFQRVAAYFFKYSERAGKFWDLADAAEKKAVAVGDERHLLSDDDSTQGMTKMGVMLHREEIYVEQIDSYVDSAYHTESDEIDQFSALYGPDGVSHLRHDLSDALTNTRAQVRHWRRALSDMMESENAALLDTAPDADVSGVRIKDEFDAANEAETKASAAKDALSNDWGDILRRLKHDADAQLAP